MSMVTKLNVEIEEKLDRIAELDPTTKEYEAAVRSVMMLMDRSIEIEKADTAEAQAEKQMEMSAAQNERQFEEEHKSRLTKNIIDIGSIVLPLLVTIWGARTSLKFEETGSITTSVGRKFIDKLLTFKK